MSYFFQQQELENFLKTKPDIKDPDGIIFGINEIGDKYELTLNEIGELYETTQKIVSGEIKTGEIVTDLSAKIVSTKRIGDVAEEIIGAAKRIMTPGLASEPKDSEKPIFESDIKKQTERIAVKFNLNSEQKAKFGEIIDSILRGAPLSGLRMSLVNNLGLSYDQALKIAFEVNREILIPKEEGRIVLSASQIQPHRPSTPPQSLGPVPPMSSSQPTRPSPPPPSPPPRAPRPERNEVLERQRQVGQIDQVTPERAERRGSERLVVDHEKMERETGPHLHSQTLMPQKTAPPQNIPSGPASLAGQKFGTIIDQKLSGIVRAPSASSAPRPNVEEQRKEKYGARDPYREPLQ